MTSRTRNVRLGLFVIAAVVTLLAVLIALAGGEWRQRKFPAYTLFTETVQGLEVGSAVKFRGVTIGRVERITLRDDQLHVRVDFELYGGSVTLADTRDVVRFLREQVEHGARCRLEYAGITGLKYIDIDFFTDATKATPRSPVAIADETHFYLPSVTSMMAGLTSDLSVAIARISDVDFNQIGTTLNKVLVSMDGFLRDERIGALVTSLSRTGADLQTMTAQLRRQLEEKDTIGKVNTTLDDIRALIAELRVQLDAAHLPRLAEKADQALTEYRQLPESVRAAADEFANLLVEIRFSTVRIAEQVEQVRLDATAQETRETLRALRHLEAQAAAVLDDTRRALDAIAAAAQAFEADPSAVLRGKRTPPVTLGGDR